MPMFPEPIRAFTPEESHAFRTDPTLCPLDGGETIDLNQGRHEIVGHRRVLRYRCTRCNHELVDWIAL